MFGENWELELCYIVDYIPNASGGLKENDATHHLSGVNTFLAGIGYIYYSWILVEATEKRRLRNTIE